MATCETVALRDNAILGVSPQSRRLRSSCFATTGDVKRRARLGRFASAAIVVRRADSRINRSSPPVEKSVEPEGLLAT